MVWKLSGWYCPTEAAEFPGHQSKCYLFPMNPFFASSVLRAARQEKS
jgi:hypothetical protein